MCDVYDDTLSQFSNNSSNSKNKQKANGYLNRGNHTQKQLKNAIWDDWRHSIYVPQCETIFYKYWPNGYGNSQAMYG